MKGAPIVGALAVALAFPGVAAARVLARLPGGTVVRSLQLDARARLFVLGASGEVTVLAPDGAPLAIWHVPAETIAVSPAGDVYAADGGDLTRFAYDGRPLQTVATRESAIAALAFDPRGSLLVNGNRYGLDGSYLGAVLQAGGDPVIDTDGRIWLAGATSVAGYDEDGRQFSMAGEDCLIGGGLDPPSCWGGVGAFQGTPRLSARPGGGVVATDPAADRVQELDAQGRLLAACTHLLPTPVEAAARTPSTLLLAAGTAIYALADPECPKPPLRFERVRFTRRARSRWRLSFALTRPAHILVTLRRRDIVAQREYASRHRRRIDLRRCDGGCLPHGRWQVIVRAVDARGNEADVPWRTIPL